mmetsp:Transcript_28130/g.68404  ORF Transcript_28130/g.68404 Transcript_28130/m.68404 type:complete len:144 (+) Transcript_28130:978-1409(+)
MGGRGVPVALPAGDPRALRRGGKSRPEGVPGRLWLPRRRQLRQAVDPGDRWGGFRGARRDRSGGIWNGYGIKVMVNNSERVLIGRIEVLNIRTKLEKHLDKNRMIDGNNNSITHISMNLSFPGKFSFDKSSRKKLMKIVKEAN